MTVGLVWSSMTSGTNLCPFTPPMAFCASIRAMNPDCDPPSWDAPAPVSELT